MLLRSILADIHYTGTCPDADISDLYYDSRKAKKNGLFFCIPGERVDGHDYVMSAYQNGVRVFITERPVLVPEDSVFLMVPSARYALAKASAAFFGYPAKRLQIIGVTGTKGKTTISNMLGQVLNACSIPTGIIGTNGIIYNGKAFPTSNTTPESYELHKAFRDMADDGIKTAVMEVSSQALKMQRTADIMFDIGIFTNLAPDHIGPSEHKDFDEYLQCKAMLFKQCRLGFYNRDDDYAEEMIRSAHGRAVTYALEAPADYNASDIRLWQRENVLGIVFNCSAPKKVFRVLVSMPGRFNAYNAMAVISVCLELGIDVEIILRTLATASVKGRMEQISARADAIIMIDYAHNKLSLESALTAMREYRPKRLVCLFGSVGGRTQLRRRDLGSVASRLADMLIVTSDNPGYEDPAAIISDIVFGFERNCPYLTIPDRSEAVARTVKLAKSGDIILLAGKGHEDYQLIKGERIPFSEKEIVLNNLGE